MTEQQLPNHSKDWQDLPPIDALLDHDDDDDDDDLDSACALNQDPSLCHMKDHIDLHSTLYHQHVLTANRSMPASLNRDPNKMSESSSSKSKLKAMSDTGTITVVTKTTTTITGFPVAGVSSRRFDTMVRRVAQQASSPNISSSDSSSSSSDEKDSDADMFTMDSRSKVTPSSLSPARQKHRFSRSYQHHASSTTASTSTHPQVVSQSTRTPKILKPKSTEKTAMAKNNRTTTSYDAETTAYLRKAFFNYYSKQCKLTREQREAVIRETGLRSRNITYWFSNHKRRLGTELAIYRKLTREHKIQDYDAFVQWRQDQELPTYITREEVRLFTASQ
ncbi:uncharacterized protein ATC70_010511 [Mucor velutinosus]|uniref:Homeobox domain-containing protein n=1 Tax=Mucor velutinosus TaxID=708070 RepID=A0AAN7DIJ8_9FUNG|nr:hypothetical protein ATC70_010511 [Mucor velutinosus]